MNSSEVWDGVKQRVVKNDKVLLDKLIERKDLVHAHNLALKSSEITFDDKLAFRLLRLAIELENEQCIHDVILRTSDLNTDEGGMLVWQALSILNNVRITTTLVKAGTKINVRCPDNQIKSTLLHVMATKRNDLAHYDLALLLMDRGADVNETDTEGFTALHYVVLDDAMPDEMPDVYSYVLAAELVRRGARVEVVNNQGDSVIDLAKSNFKFNGQLTPMLIASADVDDDVKCRWIFETVLVITRDCVGNLDGLRTLLELGFPVLKMTEVFPELWKPLHFAVDVGKKGQVEILLDYGLDVNVKFNIEGVSTALHEALRKNFKRIATKLIERGADIRATDRASREPIHVACLSNLTRTVRLLLRLDADLNIIDSQGEPPFSMIDPVPQSESLRKCLTERFAILSLSGAQIKDEVEKSFLHDNQMAVYLPRCLNELRMIRQTEIANGISLICLLTESVKTISFFARDNDFNTNFHENKQQFQIMFPVYFKEMEYTMKMTQARNNMIVSKEEALRDVLDLPGSVITMIVELALFDELVHFEKRYHIYKKIK